MRGRQFETLNLANDTVMYDVNDSKWKLFEGLLILILKLITLLKLRYKALSWEGCMYFSYKSSPVYAEILIFTSEYEE